MFNTDCCHITLFHSTGKTQTLEKGLSGILYSLWRLSVWWIGGEWLRFFKNFMFVSPYKKCLYESRTEESACVLGMNLCSISFILALFCNMAPFLFNCYEIYLLIESEDIWFWYWFMFKKNLLVDHICGLSSGIHSFSGSKHFQ